MQVNGPWFLMGDFNNVCNPQDRIRGNLDVESEYMDFINIMDSMGLFEKDNFGDHFTWFNKHVNEVVYSRTNRVICNMQWSQKHMGTILNVMDHGYLIIPCYAWRVKRKIRRENLSLNFKMQSLILRDSRK